MNKKIDKNGFFVCDTFDKVSSVVIDVSVPSGLYLPRWNGSEWVEGKKESELLEIKLNSMMISISLAVQKMLDDKALEKGFNDLKSGSHMDRAVTYAGYDNVFKDDALTLASWRSAVWLDLETKMNSGEYDLNTLTVDFVLNTIVTYEEYVSGSD